MKQEQVSCISLWCVVVLEAGEAVQPKSEQRTALNIFRILLQLIHVPIDPEELSFQESRLRTCYPDREMTRQVSCITH